MIPRWIAFYRGPNQHRAGSAFDREFQGSGDADVLWISSSAGRRAAFGPPRSTVRVYYAEHAGQTVLLHVATGKHGRGKLAAVISECGAEIDDQDRLVARR